MTGPVGKIFENNSLSEISKQTDSQFGWNDPWMVIYQLCTLCEKVYYIHFLPEFTAYSAANMKIFKQLVKGVDFIHSNGLIHRDLKVCKVEFVLVCLQ